MIKKIIIFFVFFSLLTGISLGIADFTLKKLDGTSFKLSDHLGKKVIIIDFWATWCKPCKKMLKGLQKIKNEYNEKVEVLAVSIDNTSALSRVESLIKSKKYDFQVLLDSENKLSSIYNPSGTIPFTMVIDLKGKIVYTHSGYMAGFERVLKKKLKKWL